MKKLEYLNGIITLCENHQKTDFVPYDLLNRLKSQVKEYKETGKHERQLLCFATSIKNIITNIQNEK